MDTKFNEATVNRPEGDRIIEAPFVYLDIANTAKQLREEEAWLKNDRNGITLFKSGKQTTVLTTFHAGAQLSENQIKGNITLHVIEGLIILHLGGEGIELRAGTIAALQPDVIHSITAADDSLVLINTFLY